jgi:hypothetical protein
VSYFSVLLFLGMLIMLEAGRRMGVWRRSKEAEAEHRRGSVRLVWLADAIHFFGAALRFNEKRMLITEEATAIETAYLRLHLVPEAKPEL